MSLETLQEPFFENLWPLVLKWNRCAIRSMEYSKFFEPCQRFDVINANAILAAGGVSNYTLPVKVGCFKKEEIQIESRVPALPEKDKTCINASLSSSIITSSSSIISKKPKQKIRHNRLCRLPCKSNRISKNCQKRLELQKKNKEKYLESLQVTSKTNTPFNSLTKNELSDKHQQGHPEIEDDEVNEENIEDDFFQDVNRMLTNADHYCSYRKFILEPLNKQFNKQYEKSIQRQKLSYNFMSRQEPWFIEEQPWQSNDLSDLTPELESQFKCPSFEYDVLRAIYQNRCRFIIIHMTINGDISEIKQWTKLCNIIQIITITHCRIMARQISLLGDTFHAVYVNENLENTWQEELECALHCGYVYAFNNKILKHCAQNFVFVFSSNRNLCTSKTYRVLQKI